MTIKKNVKEWGGGAKNNKYDLFHFFAAAAHFPSLWNKEVGVHTIMSVLLQFAAAAQAATVGGGEQMKIKN